MLSPSAWIGIGQGGAAIETPVTLPVGKPIGGAASKFNIGGAPIAILGGVFSGGLPLGGPVTKAFRSGGPIPPTLFAAVVGSSGPIGGFMVGGGGAGLGGLDGGGGFGALGKRGTPIGQNESVPVSGCLRRAAPAKPFPALPVYRGW